jgi:hypothetical protein
MLDFDWMIQVSLSSSMQHRLWMYMELYNTTILMQRSRDPEFPPNYLFVFHFFYCVKESRIKFSNLHTKLGVVIGNLSHPFIFLALFLYLSRY